MDLQVAPDNYDRDDKNGKGVITDNKPSKSDSTDLHDKYDGHRSAMVHVPGDLFPPVDTG